MYRSKETDSKICQSLHHLSSSEDTFAKAKNNFPDFTSLSSNCNVVTLSYIYIYRYAYDIIWHFIVQKQKTIYVCSNNIYRFRVLQNPLRSFRQTMRFEDMVVLFSSDPMRMNFEHSWKTMPSSGFDFTG